MTVLFQKSSSVNMSVLIQNLFHVAADDDDDQHEQLLRTMENFVQNELNRDNSAEVNDG